MGGHLGTRVSALLDGQLPAAEAERAWAHVHTCHACRDQVEREGWIKTSLAGLSHGASAAPDHLKGSLLGGAFAGARHEPHPLASYAAPPRRNLGLVAMGGGAVGAVVLGVVALSVAPADSPVDRREPPTSLTRYTDAPRLGTPLPTTGLRNARTP